VQTAKTYSGQTVIEGGASTVVKTRTNVNGTPDYAHTDGARSDDGSGGTAEWDGTETSLRALPTTSNLNCGPDTITGWCDADKRYVQQQVGHQHYGGAVDGSGGSFCGDWRAADRWTLAILGARRQIVWGANGLVPFGSSLIFRIGDRRNSHGTFNQHRSTSPAGTASLLVGDTAIKQARLPRSPGS